MGVIRGFRTFKYFSNEDITIRNLALAIKPKLDFLSLHIIFDILPNP